MEPKTKFFLLLRSVNKCFIEKNSACDYQVESLISLIKRCCYDFMANVNAQGALWTEDIGQNLLSALLREFPSNDRKMVSDDALDWSICNFVRDFYETKVMQRREPVFTYLYYILFYGVLQTFMKFHGFDQDHRKKLMSQIGDTLLVIMDKNLEHHYDYVKEKLPEDAPMTVESLTDFPRWLLIDGGVGVFNRSFTYPS